MTVGVAGAWCPSRSSRDRRANPCPPGTSLNPVGGGGCLGVGVCAASSPGLHPSGTRVSCCCATAALGLGKRSTRSSRALLSEGPVPVEPESWAPHRGMDPRDSGPFPQGSLKRPPLLAWGSRQHFLQEALTDFPCLSAPTALHGGSEFPLLLVCPYRQLIPVSAPAQVPLNIYPVPCT